MNFNPNFTGSQSNSMAAMHAVQRTGTQGNFEFLFLCKGDTLHSCNHCTNRVKSGVEEFSITTPL